MIEILRRTLSQRTVKRIVSTSRVPAAVILPLFDKDGECAILFTRRTDTVKDHKGQISFPGGRYEPEDDNLLGTALREFTEEIGLPAEHVQILGELDERITMTSNYIVSVFVGMIPYPCDFKVAPDEIAQILEIPIATLTDTRYQQAKPELFTGFPLPTYRYGDDVIWGATARILQQFLEVWVQSTGDGPVSG
jgi:8-oxo-dGTP pyrophosphatase MutT (NUDIX family)